MQREILAGFLDWHTGEPRAPVRSTVDATEDANFDYDRAGAPDCQDYQKQLAFTARRALKSLARRGLVEAAGVKRHEHETYSRNPRLLPAVIVRESSAWRLTEAGIETARKALADSKASYAAYMASLPEETRAKLDALAGSAKAAIDKAAGS